MASLLFYKNVVALDREAHKSLKMRSAKDMNFCADATAVPIVAAEFVDVARECPIAFLHVPDGSPLPVALMGLPNGKNLYLDKKGKWSAPYVPAFIRRYPFVFAETGPDQLTVCIDRDFDGFDEAEGEPLFEAEGKPAPLLEQAMQMLTEYQRQSALTQAFTRRLSEAGLLTEVNADMRLNDGRSLSVPGLLVVDEARFRQIPEATLKEWFASGELALVYAHLMSLGNLLELVRRQPKATH